MKDLRAEIIAFARSCHHRLRVENDRHVDHDTIKTLRRLVVGYIHSVRARELIGGPTNTEHLDCWRHFQMNQLFTCLSELENAVESDVLSWVECLWLVQSVQNCA